MVGRDGERDGEHDAEAEVRSECHALHSHSSPHPFHCSQRMLAVQAANALVYARVHGSTWPSNAAVTAGDDYVSMGCGVEAQRDN